MRRASAYASPQLRTDVGVDGELAEMSACLGDQDRIRPAWTSSGGKMKNWWPYLYY